MSIVVCSMFMNNNMCIFDCVCMYSTSNMYQLKILTDQVEVYLLT